MGLILIKHYTDSISKNIICNSYITDWVLLIMFVFFLKRAFKMYHDTKEGINKNGKLCNFNFFNCILGNYFHNYCF